MSTHEHKLSLISHFANPLMLRPLVLAAALSMVAASVAEAGGKRGIAPGDGDGQASASTGKDGGSPAKDGALSGGVVGTRNGK